MKQRANSKMWSNNASDGKSQNHNSNMSVFWILTGLSHASNVVTRPKSMGMAARTKRSILYGYLSA
jgi:hypothetical protein